MFCPFQIVFVTCQLTLTYIHHLFIFSEWITKPYNEKSEICFKIPEEDFKEGFSDRGRCMSRCLCLSKNYSKTTGKIYRIMLRLYTTLFFPSLQYQCHTFTDRKKNTLKVNIWTKNIIRNSSCMNKATTNKHLKSLLLSKTWWNELGWLVLWCLTPL